LEDLREEFHPRIKERFDGWVEVGSVMPGGGVYKDIRVDAVF
jgi:hypothetical protein